MVALPRRLEKIVSLWGFHDSREAVWYPPDKQAIDRVMAQSPSPLDLSIAQGFLQSANGLVKLDLGGYAKGYALDLGLKLVKLLGIENILINAGGDLVACGRLADRPWQVAVRHPLDSGVLVRVETTGDEAVFTSGNYERFHYHEGVRYTHIIDPRSGVPAKEIVSATVIHKNGAIADAAATALAVSAIHDWRERADSMGVEYAIVVDRNGRTEMTPQMFQRTRLG